MSSLTLLGSSSETSTSLKSESSSDSIPITRTYDPNYSKAKLWLASAESKVCIILLTQTSHLTWPSS